MSENESLDENIEKIRHQQLQDGVISFGE